VVTVGEGDGLPSRSGTGSAGAGPAGAVATSTADSPAGGAAGMSVDVAPGHDALTVRLPASELPGGAAPAEPPAPRRRRAERLADEERRRIPWWWIAGGLVVLALVGRGVVGAALGPDAGAPSASPGRTGPPTADASTTVTPSTGVDQSPTTLPTAAPTPPPTEARVTLPLATAPPPPSATTSRTSSAAALRCAVTADISPFWGGYNATVTVTNTGAGQVKGWRLSFSIPNGQQITSSWNAHVTVGGTTVRATDAGFNSTLAPRGSIQFGFQAQYGWGGPGQAPGGWGGPYGFALNGVACS
jgi:cellulase/cellobiase CelA1